MAMQEIANDIKKTFEIPNGHMSHSALQLLDDPLQKYKQTQYRWLSARMQFCTKPSIYL